MIHNTLAPKPHKPLMFDLGRPGKDRWFDLHATTLRSTDTDG